MSPSKAHPFPKMVLVVTAIIMMLINLSYAVTNNREDFTFEPLFKRSVTQAGVGNHIPSSSTSFSHAAASGISSTDNASAGGMHDKWPNGQDGKPKDLQAYHESRRALYKQMPIPTEPGTPIDPYPYHPKNHLSPSPSPAPAPSPSSNPKKQNRKLLRYTDQGQPKPLKSPPASGPTGAGRSSSSSLAPASAPSPQHGRERIPDEPPAKGGNGRKLSESGKSRLRQKRGRITKRSLVTGGGSGSSGSGGVVNYSGTDAHSTSQSGLYGTWANGESGRPIHPNERKLFHPFTVPPGSQYQIDTPGAPFPKVVHSSNSAPSPAPSASGNPKKQNRKLLRYTDQGPPKPLKTPPASGPTGARSSSPSLAPASAPSPQRGTGQTPDEPPTKGGNGRKLTGSGKGRLPHYDGGNKKRSLQYHEADEMYAFARRALVTGGGSGSGGSVGAVNYSGTNAHWTSQSGLHGTWPDGNSGRPIHPNERKLFNPYAAPPKSQYQIAPPGTPHPKFVPSSSSAPSPSPASAPSPSSSARRLLSTNKTSKKCRLRDKC